MALDLKGEHNALWRLPSVRGPFLEFSQTQEAQLAADRGGDLEAIPNWNHRFEHRRPIDRRNETNGPLQQISAIAWHRPGDYDVAALKADQKRHRRLVFDSDIKSATVPAAACIGGRAGHRCRADRKER